MSMMRLSEAAAAIGAELVGRDVLFDSVATDTRTMQPRALFVALAGERFDGHDFVAQAMQQGAAAALPPHDPECNRYRDGECHSENLWKLERLCPVRAIRFGFDEPFLMSERRARKGKRGEKDDQGNAGVFRLIFAH